MLNRFVKFLHRFKFFLLYTLVSLMLPYMLFAITSFFNIPVLSDMWMPYIFIIFLSITFLVTFLFWEKIEVTGIKKRIMVSIVVLLSILSPFLVFIALLFSPVQLEHDRIMYDICMPALQKYYGVKEGAVFPSPAYMPADQEGFGKWWYQHLECEENVQKGKGPVFSDNPSEFKPVD